VFETAELGRKVSRADYKAQVPTLRTELLRVQSELGEADFPVLIVISGVDGAGKGETINLLNAWMDPRYLETHAFGPPSDEERERPEYWRFWRTLPGKGRIAIYSGSWYSGPIARAISAELDEAALSTALQQINTFEKELADDGALIVKLWFHLSKDAQKRRLKLLQRSPKTSWRVTELDRRHLKTYDCFREVAERVVRTTSTGEVPWLIVEGADERYRSLTVGQHLVDRISGRLAGRPTRAKPQQGVALAPQAAKGQPTILSALDLSEVLPKATYQHELAVWQGRLNQLWREADAKRLSSILVFEGWDAAGKGGIIRRITPAMDARHYQVISIGPPTDEERARHYLWRFWRHLPRAGRVTIFDRSWYGRVLVERIEGFAAEDEWMRAYGEINDFEQQLVDHGILLVKYWIHIDPDEQLTRFRARESSPFKQHKISPEDYRNREKWDAYEQAVNDLVERTTTRDRPWTLIEGNDKRYARVRTLRVFCERLEQAL
jgi:polyphosphate:AMP phosphotransferase